MSRYMLIMRSTPRPRPRWPVDNIDFDEIIAQMERYNEELIKAGVMLAGEGLTDPDEGFVVDFNADPPVVTDGPYTEAKELFSRFWILEVTAKEEAQAVGPEVPAGMRREAGGPPSQRDRRVSPGQRVGSEGNPVEGRPRGEGRKGRPRRQPLIRAQAPAVPNPPGPAPPPHLRH